MNSIRKIYVTLFCVFFLLGGFPLTVYGDDYTSAKVTAIKKATTTAGGQKMEYPKTAKPEVTALLVEIPSETYWMYIAALPLPQKSMFLLERVISSAGWFCAFVGVYSTPKRLTDNVWRVNR